MMNKTIPLRLRTYEELQEIIIELNARVMLKDRQIKEALRIIEEKRGEYDIPEELEETLKDDE